MMNVLLAGLIAAAGLSESAVAFGEGPVSRVPIIGLLSTALLVSQVHAGHRNSEDNENASLPLRGLHRRRLAPAADLLVEEATPASFGEAISEIDAKSLEANSLIFSKGSVGASGDPSSTLLRGNRELGGVSEEKNDCGGRGSCTNGASCDDAAGFCQCGPGWIPNPAFAVADAGWLSCLDINECLDEENPVCIGENDPPKRYKCIWLQRQR